MNGRLLHLIAFATATTGAGAAAPNPLLPDRLEYQGVHTRQVIPFRDGVLVECGDEGTDSVLYAQFDAKQLTPFRIEGMQHLLDVERSAKGVLFLGLKDERVVMMMEETAEGKRQALPLPDEFHPQLLEEFRQSNLPKLMATNHKAAVITGDVVWWLAAGKQWKHRKLPEVPRFYHEFRPAHFGSDQYLEGTTLYAGWDHGEWGGMLASIDLGIEGAKWVHLSGKAVPDPAGIPQNVPVHSILSPTPGHLWVATGLAHMGGAWRGLHHRDPQGKWHTSIDGEFGEDRGALRLPVPSSLEGLAADREGQVYLLASDAGIFRLTKEGIDPVVECSFTGHLSDRGGYIVGSHPNDLGISRTGDLYVSTNAFGVLAFRKTGEAWSARQITLHEESEPAPDAARPSE